MCNRGQQVGEQIRALSLSSACGPETLGHEPCVLHRGVPLEADYHQCEFVCVRGVGVVAPLVGVRRLLLLVWHLFQVAELLTELLLGRHGPFPQCLQLLCEVGCLGIIVEALQVLLHSKDTLVVAGPALARSCWRNHCGTKVMSTMLVASPGGGGPASSSAVHSRADVAALSRRPARFAGLVVHLRKEVNALASVVHFVLFLTAEVVEPPCPSMLDPPDSTRLANPKKRREESSPVHKQVRRRRARGSRRLTTGPRRPYTLLRADLAQFRQRKHALGLERAGIRSSFGTRNAPKGHSFGPGFEPSCVSVGSSSSSLPELPNLPLGP